MHTSEESKGRAKAKHLFLFDAATEFAKFSRRAANRSPFIRRHDVAVLPVPMSVTDQPDHDRNDRCGLPPEGREGNLLPAPLALPEPASSRPRIAFSQPEDGTTAAVTRDAIEVGLSYSVQQRSRNLGDSTVRSYRQRASWGARRRKVSCRAHHGIRLERVLLL